MSGTAFDRLGTTLELLAAGATFINRFSVHGDPAAFEEAFSETSTYMAVQPGFIGHVLLQHTDAPDRFVNLAWWERPAALRRAVAEPEFRAHAAALRGLSVSEPSLFRTRRIGIPGRPVLPDAESGVAR